jgi:hypothetical protein
METCLYHKISLISKSSLKVLKITFKKQKELTMETKEKQEFN